jgi:hypothetical protein
MAFGVLLIAVGLAGYVMTGSMYPTALIPCWIGIVIGVSGFMAIAEKRRALFMHIAVTVGLLGFLGTAKGAFDFLRGQMGKFPVATEEKALTALICLVFVGICVRSFIAARKARTAV